MKEVTAIFDIGKTNKKFFLFDDAFNEVFSAFTRMEEHEDEDGFPCEDLTHLTNWLRETFREAQAMPEFRIKRLNFSTYGASMVHVDKSGAPVAPLYNYLKPYPEDLLETFFTRYGPAEEWSVETASPVMGMLNSGLQLYWLKYHKPDTFARIHRSLHFCQYCSYLFTGKYVSDYTSIGSHTGMWDFLEKDYHRWIYDEEVDRMLPAIQSTVTATECNLNGYQVKVGTGIHDSSAALFPYLVVNKDPFLLISTGTWSIALNPFSSTPLTSDLLRKDCLNYLRVDGKPVRAARLFLGNEYKIWAHKLAEHFDKPYEWHRDVQPDPEILGKLQRFKTPLFRWESIKRPDPVSQPSRETDLGIFSSYEEAYHQLMVELADLQVETIHLALGDTDLRTVYIDGGFIDNALFVKLLAGHLAGFNLVTTESPLGSALGAAMAVHNKEVDEHFLLRNFSLQKQKAIHL